MVESKAYQEAINRGLGADVAERIAIERGQGARLAERMKTGLQQSGGAGSSQPNPHHPPAPAAQGGPGVVPSGAGRGKSAGLSAPPAEGGAGGGPSGAGHGQRAGPSAQAAQGGAGDVSGKFLTTNSFLLK